MTTRTWSRKVNELRRGSYKGAQPKLDDLNTSEGFENELGTRANYTLHARRGLQRET